VNAAARPERRARLKLVVAEPAETETIERILHKRLRERRERRIALQAARQRIVYALVARWDAQWRAIAAQHAGAQRHRHRINGLGWISIADALYIADTDDCRPLLAEIKNGLPCRFVHRRWWQHKPVTQAVRDIADIQENRLVDRRGVSLEDDQWVFRVSEWDWRERLGKPSPDPEAGALVPAESDAPHQAEQSDISDDIKTLAAVNKTKKRAKVRAQLRTYSDHVAEHLIRTREYPSEADDKTWAENNGYVQKHVTTVLRPQYREGLNEAQQAEFQDVNKGKHRPKDPGS
jgi:hypothetical protein